MAKGDKSLGEEHAEWYRAALAKVPDSQKEWLASRHGPTIPQNRKRGTCPWCGGAQAQVGVLQEGSSGELGRYDRYSDYLPYTKARVCLACGRVELTDSKPEG